MTNYERGVKLERDIEHLFNFRGDFCKRFAGSHSCADLVLCINDQVWFIQCKLHEKLRDPVGEYELKQLAVADFIGVYTAWYGKQGKKKVICFHNLRDDNDFVMEPLTKEEEKQYQDTRKAYFANKRNNTMVPNTIKHRK